MIWKYFEQNVLFPKDWIGYNIELTELVNLTLLFSLFSWTTEEPTLRYHILIFMPAVPNQ